MEPILLALATIILGPPALLIYLGRKYIYLKMSQPDRRDFLIGFFGALLQEVAVLAVEFLARVVEVDGFGHSESVGWGGRR